MVKQLIFLTLLISFSVNLVTEWEGISFAKDSASQSLTQCIDSFSQPCDCPEDGGCPNGGCQDCHCCHSHLRYITQSPSLAVAHSLKEVNLNKLKTNLYAGPFLEPNRRPPKYQSKI